MPNSDTHDRLLIVEDDAAQRTGSAEAADELGLQRGRRERRPRGAREGRARPPVDRAERHGDAEHGRPRTAARAETGRRRRHDGAAHRAGFGRNGRRGDQAGRLRLPHQAGRSAATAHRARSGDGAERDLAGSARAAAATAGARHIRQHGRRQPRDAEDLPVDRTGGADVRVGARSMANPAPARSWSRRPSINSVRAPRSRSCRSTARRFPTRCSSPNCSATKKARSRARSPGAPARSNSRIGARCFSTKSPK